MNTYIERDFQICIGVPLIIGIHSILGPHDLRGHTKF